MLGWLLTVKCKEFWRNGRSLIWHIARTFSWKSWVNPRKILKMIRVPVEIRTGHLPNTSQIARFYIVSCPCFRVCPRIIFESRNSFCYERWCEHQPTGFYFNLYSSYFPVINNKQHDDQANECDRSATSLTFWKFVCKKSFKNARLSFRVLWLLYVTRALKWKILRFTHILFVCPLSDALNKQWLYPWWRINWLVFVLSMYCVFCATETECLSII